MWEPGARPRTNSRAPAWRDLDDRLCNSLLASRGWLGTPPPERGRSTAQRSGGGQDPHPIPPLFQGRESFAARPDQTVTALFITRTKELTRTRTAFSSP